MANKVRYRMHDSPKGCDIETLNTTRLSKIGVMQVMQNAVRRINNLAQTVEQFSCRLLLAGLKLCRSIATVMCLRNSINHPLIQVAT